MTTTTRSRQQRLAAVRGHLRDPLYRNSYWLMAGMAMSAGTGFLFWLAAARLSPASQVGQAAALVSAVLFISYLTSFGFPYGVLRFARDPAGSRSIVWAAIGLSAASSVAASAVFAAGTAIWAPDVGSLLDSSAEIAAFAAFNVAVAVGVLVDNVCAARRRAEIAFARNLAAGLGKLVALLLLHSRGPVGIYVAMFLPMVLATAAVLPLLVGRGAGPGRSPGSLREFFAFSAGNYPASLMSGGPVFALPIIVLGLEGPTATAWFYVAWNVALVLQLMPHAVSQVSMSEGSDADPWELAARARSFGLRLMAVPVLVAVVAADPLLSIYGAAYAEHGALLLRLFALSVIPWVLVAVDLSALRAEGRYRDVSEVTAAYAVLTLALPAALQAWLGLEGIAAGWLAGVTLTAGLVHLRARSRRSRRERLSATRAAA